MEGIWLGMLEESGALGQELAEYFRTEGIKINFVNKDFAMRLELNGSISVGRGYIDRMVAQEGYDAHKLFFTQFGHEIQHHQQGYINAVSIQGEYLAYETQMELAKNWDNAHGTNTSRTLNAEVLPTLGDWDTLATNLDATSYADMTQFYNHFLAPHYKWTPIFPWPSEIRRMLE
ncbi:MAG: hypothetical protein GY803_10095 [Chloroflexi bacterium]|nr:hypothetical protein [Chloroflexota bacterium]